MAKFKVGDIVIIKDKNEENYGKIGTITEIQPKHNLYTTEVTIKDYGSDYFNFNQMKIADCVINFKAVKKYLGIK